MGLFSTLYAAFQLTIVLFFVYFVLTIKRIKDMVEVVSKRMFDTFNKYAPKDSNQNESLSSIGNLKRFNIEQKNRRLNEHISNEEKLHIIKEDLPPLLLPRKNAKPLTCYCIQSTSCTEPRVNVTNIALKNILNYQHPQNTSLLNRIFNHLSQVSILKKYPYPQVENIVLQDKRVQHAIEKCAYQQFQDSDSNEDEVHQDLLRRNEKRAKKLLRDMRSKLSDFLLRFTSWVLYKLFPCFLKAIVVHPAQIQMLKQASTTNLPMIFLPLHRSHLDYILMTFILLNNNVRCPLVASGDNLRIPFFGSLLRGLGAFFIKRRIDPIMGRKDHVYKAILHTYMNESLRAGHNIEFFLEGGRTRTGKPCMPKYGILSVIVEAVMDETIPDALLVPVSMNYEKLVDGNFIREQLGQPKEMETFGSAIKAIWQVLNSNYGMLRVDFNQPFSLRKLIKTFNTNGRIPPIFNKKLKSNPSTTSLYGTDVVSDEHKSIVESISKHVLYDCAHTQAIMSTNAVSFLLLNKFRNGAKIQDIVDALGDLKMELIAKNREIGFKGDYFDIINYSIEILGPALVLRERIHNDDVIKPIVTLPNVIELCYYSNTVLYCFSLESVVALATCSLDLSDGFVTQSELLSSCLELCNILQYEFIFCKPCQSLESNILEVIDDLASRHSIFKIDNLNLPERRLHLDLEDDDRIIREVKYFLKAEGTDYLFFLRSLLMPLLEGYIVTANSLEKLVGQTMLESELVNDILEDMKSQLKVGAIVYEDSVSVDSIKNALKLYQKMEMLEIHSEKKLKLYYFKENYDNLESVKSLYDKINIYRREQNIEDMTFKVEDELSE